MTARSRAAGRDRGRVRRGDAGAHAGLAPGEPRHPGPAGGGQHLGRPPVLVLGSPGPPATASTIAADTTSGMWLIAATALSWAAACIGT
jgi:hypothetical protein